MKPNNLKDVKSLLDKPNMKLDQNQLDLQLQEYCK